MPTPSPAVAIILGILTAIGVIGAAVVGGRYTYKAKIAELEAKEREDIRLHEIKKLEIAQKQEELDARKSDTVHTDLKEAYERLKREVEQLNEKVATLIKHKEGEARAERERDQIKAEAEAEKERADRAFNALRAEHAEQVKVERQKNEDLSVLLDNANRALDEQHIIAKERQRIRDGGAVLHQSADKATAEEEEGQWLQ